MGPEASQASETTLDLGQNSRFPQLLEALRAEHEREVSILLAEVQRLRAARPSFNGESEHFGANDVPSRSADTGPCSPLGHSSCIFPLMWFRSCKGGSRQKLVQMRPTPLIPEIFDSEPRLALEPIMPELTSPAACTNGTKSKIGKDFNRCCSPASCPAAQSKDASHPPWTTERSRSKVNPSPSAVSIDAFIRHRSKGRMQQTDLWPIWMKTYQESLEHPNYPNEYRWTEDVWLQEVLAAKVSSNKFPSRRHMLLTPASLTSTITSNLPLKPTSKVKLFWDFLAPLALLYDFVTIPMQVFGFEDSVEKTATDCAVLFYWLGDIWFSFNTSFFDSNGEVVSSYRKIATKYLRTWFVPDIAISGFDVITMCMSLAVPKDSEASKDVHVARMGRFLRIARVVRILRLSRVAKLQELIYSFQVYLDSEVVVIVWSLCANLFTLLVLNHLTACFWYWIGSSEDQEFTWLTVPFQGDRTFAEANKMEAYVVSLHWSLTQFTPASMVVQPQNIMERIYAVALILLAMVGFASFVSNVTAGMARLRGLQTENMEQVFKLRKFLRENHISVDLSARVIRYVDIAMRAHKNRTPKEAVTRLKWLSRPLNMELMREVSYPTLKRHLFFRHYGGCSAAAMRQLCYVGITVQPVSKWDTVFNSFGEASCMYFIKSGNLVFKRSKGLTFHRRVRLEKGDWFVEQVLWIRWVHHGTMKASTESELMAVDSQRFQEVSGAHPDVLVVAAEYAVCFAEKCRDRNACDVPQEIFDRQCSKNHTIFWEADADNVKADECCFSSDSESATASDEEDRLSDGT